MRRITMWILSTVVVLVLLFSYRTSLSGAGGTGAVPVNVPGLVSGPDAQVPAPAASGAVPATPAPSSTSKETVVNGTVAQTLWGPVQVQATISGGRIADVIALRVPDGTSRDQEINSYAVPRLREEVLAAQSARIDAVTGATVTSDGYVTSLQAALDSAHFAG